MAVVKSDPSSISVRNDNLGNVVSSGVNILGDYMGDQFSGLFNQDNSSEIGRVLGNTFSSGVTAATNTLANNVLKGQALTSGLSQNVGQSLAGAGVGLVSNYLGRGISSLGGNSKLSKALGAGASTFAGTVGGTVLGNLIKSGSILGKSSALFGSTANVIDSAGKVTKYGAAINPYGLAAQVVGSALGAATGPSKEYGGKYGTITQIGDATYDAATMAVNAIPGWGQLASGMMALNKGLSNVFGSTSGMTVQDAILGSAFMPALVKWVNMIGAKTTDTFKNQSWQNYEKTNSFMGNAFGNLNDRFDQAREEAGKTYGLFSRGAYGDAQDNIDFANQAWNKILSMADQNELQKIRSQYMSSINNQRYAQQIMGGWKPLYRGKQGMKIFNNATNHNMGMRLLSAAALIDNKQMILCNAHD